MRKRLFGGNGYANFQELQHMVTQFRTREGGQPPDGWPGEYCSGDVVCLAEVRQRHDSSLKHGFLSEHCIAAR